MSGCLLADIGGTKARFAVLRDSRLGAVETLATRDYANAIDAIRDFLGRHSEHGIDSAVIAGAGPVQDGRCALTNASWVLDSGELAKALGLRTAKVVNDLVALAWAAPEFVASDVITIGRGQAAASEPIVLIAPGTGLGMACFVPDGAQAMASEGGHATLASTTDDEAAAVKFLHRRYGHVSAERVLSGGGLVNLYDALADHQGAQPPSLAPEEIVRTAIDGQSERARRALDMFCAFLGSVAGNAALTFAARGGVLIAGGIAPRIVDYLRKADFRERFENKGRLRDYLARIPTRIVIRPDPAFLGLAALANRDRAGART
ncbi:glucokinase [Reyranella soli]|uniref:Glucokinase n=1 Tax=Reyranella soli TaxID=1230389 RepID=A0A512NDU6_9HYPH|nr:glucokinase [Reyranella soli]GEP57092.1 glucokinase [Reyranella soli]